MPAVPLRSDWDAVRVRDAARSAEDAGQARRLLAVAAVYDGMSRAAAAALGGMDRQTLRDWVHRFNAAGPSGLVDRKAPGAAPRLTAAQEPSSRRWLRRVRSPRPTASCAGAAST